MPIKSILVHADVDPAAESRVRLAAGLARHWQAGLVGAVARLPMPLLDVYSGGAAMVSAGMLDVADETAEAAFKTAEEQFGRWTAGAGLVTAWRTAIDFPANALADMSAAVDLVVIGPNDGEQVFNAGDLVMKSGRPVLVVPAGCNKLDGDRVVVAWKNTREARRALSDALPFLGEAKSVTLLHVGETSEDEPAIEDAVAFLRNHGVTATTEMVAAGGMSAAGQIEAAAKRARAGLVVLGAYGHSRLREWAFGGVTRDLLGRCPVPCLFGH